MNIIEAVRVISSRPNEDGSYKVMTRKIWQDVSNVNYIYTHDHFVTLDDYDNKIVSKFPLYDKDILATDWEIKGIE